MFEEAIAEYAKEYDRPINNGIDAEIGNMHTFKQAKSIGC